MPRKFRPLASLTPAYRKRIESYQRRHPHAKGRIRARGHVSTKRIRAAKKGWETRRRNWRKLLEKTMFRNTLGTQMSDKAQLYSFTLFAYSLKELDESDLNRLEKKFEDLIGKWLARHYSRNYGFKDYWGTEIYRREENVEIACDKDDCGNWFFEVNASQVESGILS
jgi:hypothetical protein